MVSRGLLALSHDELGVIVDGLADPLEPFVAVALSSTCRGLRTPLRAALELLEQRHASAAALCHKVCMSCAALRVARGLWLPRVPLADDDMVTLGVIVRTSGLTRLNMLDLNGIRVGDAGMRSLCEGLGGGALPVLHSLLLARTELFPPAAEALAAALRRGALPKLEMLEMSGNRIGNQGVAALATPLRRLHALAVLNMNDCEITDDGVTSLVCNIAKGDFKALRQLGLSMNLLTSASQDALDSVTASGVMANLRQSNGIGTQLGDIVTEADQDDDDDDTSDEEEDSAVD